MCVCIQKFPATSYKYIYKHLEFGYYAGSHEASTSSVLFVSTRTQRPHIGTALLCRFFDGCYTIFNVKFTNFQTANRTSIKWKSVVVEPDGFRISSKTQIGTNRAKKFVLELTYTRGGVRVDEVTAGPNANNFCGFR